MKKLITIIRSVFMHDRTLGHLYIDGKPFCWTLEDAVRPDGVKIDGKTAIPIGCYKLDIVTSYKFARDMISILNVPNFTNILIHGGNNPVDTEGCPLVAFNKCRDANDNYIIYGTAEKKIFNYVKKNLSEDIHISISNNLTIK